MGNITTMSKNILRGLAVIVPIFVLANSFWIAWVCIPADQRYDKKYDWLQDTMVYFPIALVGACFLAGVIWMLFNYIRDKKANANK